MQYLNAGEYLSFGLSAETPDSLVTAASAMIDAFCRRPTLAITQYVERFRFRGRGLIVQLSNTPLATLAPNALPLVSARMRLRPRRQGDAWAPMEDIANLFYTPGTWSSVDVTTIDIAADGELSFSPNILGLPADEVEVTYTAGFSTIPDAVKIACTQIVRNAQAMPALNVSKQVIDSMQMQYFSSALLDTEVQRVLQPYVSQKVG